MRVSVFRGTPTRPKGQKALEPQRTAGAVETTEVEPVDEQIESLLRSLDEPVRPAEPLAAGKGRRRPSRRRASRRRHALRAHVNEFDLFVVVTAVVLGVAVGLLTAFLVHG